MFINVKTAESFFLDGQVKSEILVKLREHKARGGEGRQKCNSYGHPTGRIIHIPEQILQSKAQSKKQ